MKLLTRWLVTALTLLLVARFVPGIRIEDTRAWFAVGAMALILGLVNATLRPLLRFFSRGLIAATLGLFLLVINAATFGIASWMILLANSLWQVGRVGNAVRTTADLDLHRLATALRPGQPDSPTVSWIAVNWLDIGFYIDGLKPAFLGALLLSGVAFVLSFLLTEQERPRQRV